MKNTYYYIVTLVMLILALPMKAASEAEFGKLSKTYTLHADGSQEMRVQKELTLFTHAAMTSHCFLNSIHYLQSGISETGDTRFLYSSERWYYCEDS